MSVGGRIFAAMYDSMMRGPEGAGLHAHRASLLAQAEGRVLEVGGGTGANLQYYGAPVESLTVTEPESSMLRKLERKIAEQARPVELVQAQAERLPFENDRFDTVVSTLVLCTVNDQARALSELRRVLKPRGRLLFIEHIRSDAPRLARWQDRLNGVGRVMGHGCNCNRTTLDSIRAAGFTITELEHDKLHKVPPTVSPLAVGRAEAA